MKLQVLDESRTYFPKTEAGIADKGLPMAGAVQVTVEKGMDDVEVELQRAVAKVKLTVSNATDVPMTVEQIRFGSFAADRCYLFGETDLDVSEETNYAGMLFGDPRQGRAFEHNCRGVQRRGLCLLCLSFRCRRHGDFDGLHVGLEVGRRGLERKPALCHHWRECVAPTGAEQAVEHQCPRERECIDYDKLERYDLGECTGGGASF